MSKKKHIDTTATAVEKMLDEISGEAEGDIADEEGNASLKSYRIKTTEKAERQIQRYLTYLINKKRNIQAAVAVSDDYDETIDRLVSLAGSFQFCDDEDLRRRGIRKVFLKDIGIWW